MVQYCDDFAQHAVMLNAPLLAAQIRYRLNRRHYGRCVAMMAMIVTMAAMRMLVGMF
ncbi:hypothetical protein GCM10023155_03460 [Bremerella cremea]